MDSFEMALETMVQSYTDAEELMNFSATMGIQDSPIVRFRLFQLRNPEYSDHFINEQIDSLFHNLGGPVAITNDSSDLDLESVRIEKEIQGAIKALLFDDDLVGYIAAARAPIHAFLEFLLPVLSIIFTKIIVETIISGKFVGVPEKPEFPIGRQCSSIKNCPAKNRAYYRCDKEAGRSSARCLCVPGYASRFDSDKFVCEEIQTYFIYMNLTQEIGCDTALEKEESARCYIYQPIRMLQQYNNPSTGSKYFLKIRERIIRHGLGPLFRNSSHTTIQDRFMNAEIVNITKEDMGIRIGILLYFLSDYYNIINYTDVQQEVVNGLQIFDGELGHSQLKSSAPFDDQIQWKDFDECAEQEGLYQDCARNSSWCLNTRVSYMCCCKIGFEDKSPDNLNRPGRICRVPKKVENFSLSCSNGTCETKWEYIALALTAFGLLLLFFIGYEIYARKKKLEKSDIYFKLRKAARKAKLRALRERRKTLKLKRKSGETDKETEKLVETA